MTFRQTSIELVDSSQMQHLSLGANQLKISDRKFDLGKQVRRDLDERNELA